MEVLEEEGGYRNYRQRYSTTAFLCNDVQMHLQHEEGVRS